MKSGRWVLIETMSGRAWAYPTKLTAMTQMLLKRRIGPDVVDKMIEAGDTEVGYNELEAWDFNEPPEHFICQEEGEEGVWSGFRTGLRWNIAGEFPAPDFYYGSCDPQIYRTRDIPNDVEVLATELTDEEYEAIEEAMDR